MLETGLLAETGLERETVGAAIKTLSAGFKQADLPNPRLDARLLTAEACGIGAEAAILRPGRRLTPQELNRVAQFMSRRLAGEPVSRILGRREFWGLSFAITEATLDPRPETELLVEAILDRAKTGKLLNAKLDILDLGTGSGCLLAALLSELISSRGVGLDRSEAALRVARKNLDRLGLLDRAALLCGDWLSALGEARFDVIVCNPPYIETNDIPALAVEVSSYDPRLALDGGDSGLNAYRQIVPAALRVLKPGGYMVFEIGRDQGAAVLDLMKQTGRGGSFTGAHLLKDLAGADRAVAGVRQL